MDERISHSQLRTLAALGMYGDKEGWCFPKLRTLGELLHKSRQAVSRDIQSLMALGYVEIYSQNREDGSRSSNKYRLIFDLPPQPVVDTPQQEVEAPSTLEVEAPSTSEVDTLTPQLTPHFNVLMGKGNPQAENVYRIYEQEIGPLTPSIADQLKLAEEDHTPSWVIQAIRIASANSKRSWSYVDAILRRWQVDGYGSDFPAKKNGIGKSPKSGPTALDRSLANIEAFRKGQDHGKP